MTPFSQQRAPSARFGKRASILRQEWMPEKGMTPAAAGLPPKPGRPSEQKRGRWLPILQQIDERILIVIPNQSWIQGIERIPDHMMKCHARVLRSALNEPIQRVPFLNFQPFVRHNDLILWLSAEVLASFSASPA